MNITKQQLKEIIKEELSEIFAKDNREQRDPIDTEYVNLIRKLGARTVILAIIDDLVDRNGGTIDQDAHRLVIDSLKSSMPEMAEDLEERMDTENIRHTPESCRKCGGEWVFNAAGGNCWKPKKSAKDFRQGNC